MIAQRCGQVVVLVTITVRRAALGDQDGDVAGTDEPLDDRRRLAVEHADVVDAHHRLRGLFDQAPPQPLDEFELGAHRWSIERQQMEQRPEVQVLLRLTREHATYRHRVRSRAERVEDAFGPGATCRCRRDRAVRPTVVGCP